MTIPAKAAAPADPTEHTRHLEALGWAFTDPPTREAYRRCTGEDIAPTLDRYREWAEENLIGST